MNNYFYVRVSTIKQSVNRQVDNLTRYATDVLKLEKEELSFFIDEYTGTTMHRPSWERLMKQVDRDLKAHKEVQICFDSVCRMSRKADEGCECYFELFDKGVSLVFLKEPMINTDVFKTKQKDLIPLQGIDEDLVFEGINKYFRLIAKRQVEIAFRNAEREVKTTNTRIREALQLKRAKGEHLGRQYGVKPVMPLKEHIQKIIIEKVEDGYKDIDIIKLINASEVVIKTKKGEIKRKAHICRNTYYKYKKEIADSLINNEATERSEIK